MTQWRRVGKQKVMHQMQCRIGFTEVPCGAYVGVLRKGKGQGTPTPWRQGRTDKISRCGLPGPHRMPRDQFPSGGSVNGASSCCVTLIRELRGPSRRLESSCVLLLQGRSESGAAGTAGGTERSFTRRTGHAEDSRVLLFQRRSSDVGRIPARGALIPIEGPNVVVFQRGWLLPCGVHRLPAEVI